VTCPPHYFAKNGNSGTIPVAVSSVNCIE